MSLPPRVVRPSATRRVQGTWRSADRLLVGGEQISEALVGQHREERLLVRDLAAERVGDAHGAGRVRLGQRAAVVGAREDVVDEHTAVDQVDRLAVGGEPVVLEAQVTRVADDGRDAQLDELRLQDLELGPGRHLAPVDDRDGGRRCRAAPVAIARDERVEHRRHQREGARVEPAAESRQNVEPLELARQHFRVAEARRRLRVVLGELQRVGQDERVEAGCRARRRVAGLDGNQRALVVRQRHGIEQLRPLERDVGDALSHPRDGLGHAAHQLHLLVVEEERTKERAVHAVAEVQPRRQQLARELLRKLRRQLDVGPQQPVPVLDGVSNRRQRSSSRVLRSLVEWPS